MKLQYQLRERAKELLEQQEVSAVLGFRAGSKPGTTVPVIITNPEQAEKLVINEHCRHNLAAYLPKLKRQGRLGVVATGPTSRSIVNLLKERQLERKDLFILGAPIRLEGTGGQTSMSQNPVLFDEMLGEPMAETAQDDYADIEEFERLTAEERWNVLSDELSRCIRCYACRAVCPNCYCTTCFVDAGQPGWVGRTNDPSDNVLFHIMRAMHMAGRCVECESCARACPMGIDLMKINRKVAKIVRDRFKHVSGMNLDDQLPLTTFSPDDEQEFIK